MRWPLTFIVKSLPGNAGGVANGPIIRILEKHKDDEGIYQHELLHVKQWLFTLGLHSVLYLLSDRYKLWAEVEAYKVQLRYNPEHANTYAGFISQYYGLAVTQEEALQLLKE